MANPHAPAASTTERTSGFSFAAGYASGAPAGAGLANFRIARTRAATSHCLVNSRDRGESAPRPALGSKRWRTACGSVAPASNSKLIRRAIASRRVATNHSWNRSFGPS